MVHTPGSSTTSQQGNVKYNTPPASVASQINDGDEFILIRQSRQSDEPQVWSSGDSQQTQRMFKQLQTVVQSESLEPTR